MTGPYPTGIRRGLAHALTPHSPVGFMNQSSRKSLSFDIVRQMLLQLVLRGAHITAMWRIDVM